MRLHEAVRVGLVVASSCVTLLAQRDRTAGNSTATSQIAGVVVADDSRHALVRRASVTLSGSGLPSSLITTTDDAGAFLFGRLPPGDYHLQCAKVAYVRSYYGATHPNHGPGLPVTVAEGGHADVTMVLMRGAVIAGQVSDERGRPVQTDLQVMEYQNVDGRRRLLNVTVPNETTDDRGVFRVFGLPPGDYLIGAIGRPGQWQEAAARDAAPAGLNDRQAPAPGRPTQSRAVMYAPVYYPGTADPLAATPVHVDCGDERTGISFSIRRQAASTVDGTVVDEQGQSVDGVQVRALFRTEQPADFASQLLGRTSVTTGGKFRLSGLPPSQYTLVAQRNVAVGADHSPSMLWATANVDVTGDDISGLALTLHAGRVLSGRVVADGDTPAPDLSSLRIGLQSSPDNAITVLMSPVAVSPDGRFSISGVVPGRYRIQVSPSTIGTHPSWSVHSAPVNGRDAVDAAFDVPESADVNPVVVTLSNRVASLAGSLTGSSATPAQALSVLVFSTERAFWNSTSRRIRAVHPSSDGSFAVDALPAGEYFIASLLDFVPADLKDTDFLDVLARTAFKFTLADGERKVLMLGVR